VSLVGRCCDSGWDGFERLIVSSRLRVRRFGFSMSCWGCMIL